MAAPLFKSTLLSLLSSQPERPLSNIPRRPYHVELGPREKALLQVDPALSKFKSYKNTLKVTSKVGNALTTLALAGCTYQLIFRAMTKN